MNEGGVWVDDKKHLENIAVSFYSKIFSSEEVGIAAFPTGLFPLVSGEVLQMLVKDVSISETKKALMQIGLWKDPEPDGF